jgi:hypothetical protein
MRFVEPIQPAQLILHGRDKPVERLAITRQALDLHVTGKTAAAPKNGGSRRQQQDQDDVW